MKLALSTAAAPDLPIADLLQACRRRGLAGLELNLEDDLLAPSDSVHALASRIRDAEAAEATPVIAVRLDTRSTPPDRAFALARALGVPAQLPIDGVPRVGLDVLRHHVAAGGRVVLSHGALAGAPRPLDDLIRSMPPGSAAFGLEIDPGTDRHQGVLQALSRGGPDLGYVRLRGGGPESIQQTGLGVGALMGQLALARFAGPVVLTPSTPRYHHAWRAWLLRGSGWGCGSKQADDSLVVLPTARMDGSNQRIVE